MRITDFAEEGCFEPRKLASVLRTTIGELASSVGLPEDELRNRRLLRSDKTQRRLRELVEVLNKMTPRLGSELMAYAWYRSEFLSGHGDLTPMHLVRDGLAQRVLEYVDSMEAGVHE